MKWGIFTGLLLTFFCSHAQILRNPSAGGVGAGDSWTGASAHWSVYGNPAMLSSLEDAGFGISLGQFYGIKELRNLCAVFAFNLNTSSSSGIAFNMQQNGRGVYFFQVRGALSREFSSRFSAGLVLGLNSFHLPEGHRQSKIEYSLGFLYRINDKFGLGAVYQSHASDANSKLSEELNFASVGFRYYIANDMRVCASFELGQALFTGTMGIKWPVNEEWNLQVGVRLPTASTGFVLSRKLKSIQLHFALLHHMRLGSSVLTSLDYGSF